MTFTRQMELRERLADLEHEQWRSVVGHDEYMVSSWGRVARIMKPYVNLLGYARVGLTKDGATAKKFVHTLVLGAFVGLCPEGHQCRHLNGNSADNRLDNLVWGTPLENREDIRRHGRACVGEAHPNAVLSTQEVAEARRRYRTGERNFSALSREYGCSNVSMRKAIRGETRHDADPFEVPVRS